MTILQDIRIGIIGAGQNTLKMHLPRLQAIQGVRLIEVANRSIESGKTVASKWGIPKVRASWTEVATSPEVDAVVIGTWPYLHCEATCTALNAGKHVLCEARMAMNADEAQTMLSIAQGHPGQVAQIVPAPFTLHADELVADLLNNGTLGLLSHFHMEFQSPPTQAENAPLHWRRNRKLSGNNIMMLGILYESLLRWLPPARWVQAAARVFNGRARDPETGDRIEVDVPDYLSVQLELENGIQGTLLMSERAVCPDIPFVKFFGERGSLHLELNPAGNLHLTLAGSGKNPIPLPSLPDNGWRVEEEFINSIRGRETVKRTRFETGVQYMRFTDAVNKSFREGGSRVPVAG